MKEKKFNCPVEATLSLIGGKYKPLILWHLRENSLHYMELQRLIPSATSKMLSQQLHDLEDCGMVNREVIPEKPPKTIYSLTPFGRSIIPVIVGKSKSFDFTTNADDDGIPLIFLSFYTSIC